MNILQAPLYFPVCLEELQIYEFPVCLEELHVAVEEDTRFGLIVLHRLDVSR